MSTDRFKFMIDQNVGKLAKWLRMIGYDAKFFTGVDDTEMVNTAIVENRILLTRDTRIKDRKVVTNGQLKIILINSDRLRDQIKQIISSLQLTKNSLRPFTLCIECNQSLIERNKDDIKDRLPPYVYQTQHQFVECPVCHRIYWRGTHWQSMMERITSSFPT